MNTIRPIDRYVIDSLLKENKITSDALLTIIQELTAPTDFCNKLVTIINYPKKTKRFIKLLNCGNSKLQCVKIIKQYFKLPLIETKNIVDSIPAMICIDDLTKEQIESLTKYELPDNRVEFKIVESE